MNSLTKYLVEGILAEEKQGIVVLLPGGFKPPHKGHLEVIKNFISLPQYNNKNFTVEKAKELALQNVRDLPEMMTWNYDNNIQCFRLSSDMFPHFTDTETEKFMGLVEELSYEDAATYETKVKTIRENYFSGKKTEVASVVTDAPVEVLTEEKKVATIDPKMSAYLSALNKK